MNDINHAARLFGGMNILESVHVGKIITPTVPDAMFKYRGPYKQRRIKRWKKLHPPYIAPTGEYFRMGSNTVLCHPIDAIRLRETLRNV